MGFSTWMKPARWSTLLPLTLVLAVAGCGSSAGTVSGKVYYKDAPLKGGTITVVGSDKQSYMAEIGEDGSYTIDKLPPGEARFTVETDSLRPPNQFVMMGKRPQDAAEYEERTDFAARARRFVAIPERYADPDQSGLSRTIKGGKQEYDIKLD